MNAENHLQLHRIRAAELHSHADQFRLGLLAAPRQDLRTRLGWGLVELGLRVIPRNPVVRPRAPRLV
ncbi:hypothetical protein [Streptomyces sp. NPDC001478]